MGNAGRRFAMAGTLFGYGDVGFVSAVGCCFPSVGVGALVGSSGGWDGGTVGQWRGKGDIVYALLDFTHSAYLVSRVVS